MLNSEKIIEEFNRIKSLGFIKSNRIHNTGIGKTFEDHLGVDENNAKEPDFEGFEVKSQRSQTGSYLTLFTKSPSGVKGVNKYLRDKYGEKYEEYPDLKKLHTSIFGHKHNTYASKFAFKITDSPEDERLVLEIKDIETDTTIDTSVYWTYKSLESCLTKKLNALFYVQADSEIRENFEHFHYKSAEIYLNPDINKLLKMVNEGKIMVDIRIGSYKTGKNTGKTHDHGTGFRIQSNNLEELYSEYIKI
jgi:hypothetical protein